MGILNVGTYQPVHSGDMVIEGGQQKLMTSMTATTTA